MTKIKLTPGRIIALGFALLILTGTILLLLPISQNPGVEVSFIDALFTSTSAVCITGLIAVDTADTFSIFGRTVVAALIQIGGLGVTSIGVGLILISGKRINIKERSLVKEALNYPTFKGVIRLIKSVLLMTLTFESVGMLLSLLVFSKDYPFLHALGISAFHSIAAFNNSGFDILGGLTNLIPYQDNILLNLTTCGLIIFGGLGFFVIRELLEKRCFKRFSLHTKVVLFTTGLLLLIGTLLLKLTEDITWLGAFFFSSSARTAGFSTYPLSNFTNSGLFVLVILMFIGASPGSTGGGIKTTTFFILIQEMIAVFRNKEAVAFKRRIAKDNQVKAFTLVTLAMGVIMIATYLLCLIEKETSFIAILVEVVSGFGTVGLSTGITPNLHWMSKFILVLTMYIGRLGPLTIASLWIIKGKSDISYSEESISVG